MYKIRNTITGKYSTGGKNPSFTKNGKMFVNMGAVNCHFNVVATWGGEHSPDYDLVNEAYENCVIVEYEVREINVKFIMEK